MCNGLKTQKRLGHPGHWKEKIKECGIMNGLEKQA